MDLDWNVEIDIEDQPFLVASMYDNDAGSPWDYEPEFSENVVSKWTRRAKNPGELVLVKDRDSYRYFDFKLAVQELRQMGETGKEAERIARFIFERWRDWCNDRWHYIIVYVAPKDEAGKPVIAQMTAVGGVEDDGNYWKECANELAREIIAEQKHEAQEREFALSLGIRTSDA